MQRNPSLPTVGLITSALLLAGLINPVFADPVQAETSPPDNAKRTAAKNTIQLIVDYGDGVAKHFSKIAWRDKMTVQDVTEAASKHPRGIKVKQRGKRATAFLTQIDDLANEPRGRSWVYRVNGKLADRSFGVYVVQPGDVVSWAFQTYSP